MRFLLDHNEKRQRDRGIAVTGHLNVVLCLADTVFSSEQICAGAKVNQYGHEHW